MTPDSRGCRQKARGAARPTAILAPTASQAVQAQPAVLFRRLEARDAASLIRCGHPASFSVGVAAVTGKTRVRVMPVARGAPACPGTGLSWRQIPLAQVSARAGTQCENRIGR